MVFANNNPAVQPQGRNNPKRRKRSLSPSADTENPKPPKNRRKSVSTPGAPYNPNHPPKSLYNRCNINDLKLPHQIDEKLKVVSHPIKGRGVETTQSIKAGDLILVEDPMIKRLARLPRKDFQYRLVEAVQALDDKDAKLFVQLSFYHDDFCKNQEWSRMKANAMESTREGESEVWNLYRYISFINHSCQPNCSFSLRDDDKMEIRALVKMPIGTEVEIDYCPDVSHDPNEMFELNSKFRFKMVPDRQKIIMARWGFECRCGACLNDDAINDARADANKLDSFLRKRTPRPWVDGYEKARYHFELYIEFLINQRLFCKVPGVCNFLIDQTNIQFHTGKMGKEERNEAVLGFLKKIAKAMKAEYGYESEMC